jgi:hypothetical protein
VSDACGVSTVIAYVISGNVAIDSNTQFAVGTTNCHWVATDVNGRTAVATFDVIIADDEDPSDRCPCRPQCGGGDGHLCPVGGLLHRQQLACERLER